MRNIFYLYISFTSLRQIDLEVMRRLHRKVNVVPVIAKADTLTAIEVKKLKERILADIDEHEIQVRGEYKKAWIYRRGGNELRRRY